MSTAAEECFHVTDRATLNKAAERMAAMNGPQLPLIRAAADGLISVFFFEHPDAAWPTRTIERQTRPAVCLVGDDPHPNGEAVGPNGWSCATRLRYWARACIVHGAAGRHDDYREGVAAALLTQRLVFIETDAAHLEQWAALFKTVPTQRIVSATGRHPVTPSREAMQ